MGFSGGFSVIAVDLRHKLMVVRGYSMGQSGPRVVVQFEAGWDPKWLAFALRDPMPTSLDNPVVSSRPKRQATKLRLRSPRTGDCFITIRSYSRRTPVTVQPEVGRRVVRTAIGRNNSEQIDAPRTETTD